MVKYQTILKHMVKYLINIITLLTPQQGLQYKDDIYINQMNICDHHYSV